METSNDSCAQRARSESTAVAFNGALGPEENGFALFEPVRDKQGHVVDFHCTHADAMAGRRLDLQANCSGGGLQKLAQLLRVPNLFERCLRTLMTGRPFTRETEGTCFIFAQHPAGVALWLDQYERASASPLEDGGTRNERRFKALVQATSQIVWAADATGAFIEDCAGWSAFTGQTFEECRAWGWTQAIHPEDKPRVEQQWNLALTRGATVVLEYRLRRANGTYAHVVDRGVLIQSTEGAPLEWVGIVTEKTPAEVDQQEILRALSAQPFVAINLMTGPDLVLEMVNEAQSRLMGGRPLLGKPMLEAVPELAGQPVEKIARRAFATGEVVVEREVPVRMILPGGNTPQERFFNVVCQPVRHRDALLVCSVDVTSLVRTRQEAEQRAAELEAVIQNLPEGVIILNRTGVSRINRRMLEMSGYSNVGEVNSQGSASDEHLSLGWAAMGETILDPNDHPIARALLGQMSTQELTFRNFKTGEERVVRCASAPVRLPDSTTIIGSVSVCSEITEQRRIEDERALLLASEQSARAEAEAANRMKDEFLARISHELATPLLGMRLWLETLSSNDGSRHDDALAALRQCVQAQTKLIHDLLDSSRALSGKLNIVLEACEPAEPIEAAVAAIRPMAEQKQIVLRTTLNHTPLVQADPARLQQIVSNLLSNAIKFTPSEGTVEVHLRPEENGVCIVVADTGRGFPPEFQPLLFTPFRQAEEGTTRSHGGLGLGLAIVRQLVDLHGGRVWAKSPGHNQGATFCAWFPALEEEASQRTESARRDLPARELESVRILLVEDDSLTRAAVSSVLEQHGAHVLAVASAKQGLMALSEEMPDVLLCDIAMPDEDGYSFIRKIRKLGDAARCLPAAALTAHMREEDRERALAAGFQMHIPKSVEPSQLIRQVSALARRK